MLATPDSTHKKNWDSRAGAGYRATVSHPARRHQRVVIPLLAVRPDPNPELPQDAAETVLSASRPIDRSPNRDPSTSAVPFANGSGSSGIHEARPPGDIISVESPYNINFRGLQIALLMLTIFSSIGLLIAGAIVVRSPVVILPFFMCLMFLGIFGLMYWARTRAAARGAELARQFDPVQQPETLYRLAREIRGFGAHSGLKSFLGELEKRGVNGCTFRIVKRSKKPSNTPPLDPVPLDFPFEPQILNEALSPLIRQSVGGLEPRGTTSPLARNLMLKGGLAILLMFGFNFMLAVIRSFEKRRWDYGVFSWGAGILILLFVPVGMRPWSTKQWLVVPGGMLWRGAARGAGDWKLHLFDRQTSLLLVAATRKRNYLAVIADREKSDFSLMTATEAEFLLRAWTSPIPPPPVELMRELG